MKSKNQSPLMVQKQNWEDLAVFDPLWSILTDHGKRDGGWDLAEFFETGVVEVSGIMARASELGCLARRDRALDFGCGVGRLTRALARQFEYCCGVDISETMIVRARELNRDVPNCVFMPNLAEDLRIFPSNHFDLIYSNLVLQHIPSRRTIMSYLSEFLRILNTDGLLVFQLPSYIPFIFMMQVKARIYATLSKAGFDKRLLYKNLKLSPMTINFVPEGEIERLLCSAGGVILDCQRFTDTRVFPSKSNVYYVTKKQ